MQDSTPTPIQSQNIQHNYIEDSNLKTKKKSFVSEVDPHIIKRKVQQERYIWFGVYNELLRNKNIIKILQKCKDQTLPIESAAIHLDKYKISFNKNRIFIKYNEDNVIFLKLYLITKSQFIDILKTYYLCSEDIQNEADTIYKTINKLNSDFDLSKYQKGKNAFYDILKCLGTLDDISIYSVTTSQNEIAAPDVDYLKTIFNGLKKSFQPYSEYLIMYYIYLLDGVRNYYTIKQLQEVFMSGSGMGTGTANHQNCENSNSAASSETNMTIETGNNNNRYLVAPQNTLDNLNSTPSNSVKKDNETIKCSTCNASPFLGTPEKDQLNQYSYIFDLHHLPIFDENTGEFFWSNNEQNWKNAKNNIINSEECQGKSLLLNHGSIINLSNSFMGNNNINNNYGSENRGDGERGEGKSIGYKNEANSGTFIEELNNILKDI